MDWVWIALALGAGGLMKGATGAGAPIVAVPVIALLTGDVGLAVTLLVIPNLVSNSGQGWIYRKTVLPMRFTLVFALAGLVGAGLGTVLLATLNADYLILTTSVAVCLYVAFRIARPDWTLAYRTGEIAAAPVGLVAGILQGAVGVSAPVSISFLNAMKPDRLTFIGTISIFFFAMCLAQIPLLAAYGILTWDRTALSVLALLPILAAMPVGSFLARKIPRVVFDRLILLLLVVVAIRLASSVLA